MHKSRIAALLTGLLLVLSVLCPASFAQDQDQALIKAASNGDLKQVQELLEQGADVNAKDGQGGTALMQASWQGHIDIAKALLAKGADVNAQDKHGETALMQAAWKGNLKLIKALVDKGADINAEDDLGCTALNNAVHRNWAGTPAPGSAEIRVANFLRAHGAKAGRCRNPS